jgi:hypothetical protein
MRRALARTASGVLALGSVALVAGCGQQPAQDQTGAAAAAASSSAVSPAESPSPAPSVSRSPWPLVLPVPAVPPGLHQTGTRPPARSPAFHAEMIDLWAAVVAGRPGLALPSFFPVAAYEQVKAIADPAADWRNRLVADFRLDIYAAHQLLGRQARHARLVRVLVPESEAVWVPPGACYNSVGYWHAGGARIVYKVNGQERSIGIASLISWRGRWYVVHLGAVLRGAEVGEVDDPSPGQGIAGQPGGC